jgi:hypothetical protein
LRDLRRSAGSRRTSRAARELAPGLAARQSNRRAQRGATPARGVSHDHWRRSERGTLSKRATPLQREPCLPSRLQRGSPALRTTRRPAYLRRSCIRGPWAHVNSCPAFCGRGMIVWTECAGITSIQPQASLRRTLCPPGSCPKGRRSTQHPFDAASGPVFVTWIVYVILKPATTGSGESSSGPNRALVFHRSNVEGWIPHGSAGGPGRSHAANSGLIGTDEFRVEALSPYGNERGKGRIGCAR